jgi:hypothetical protein
MVTGNHPDQYPSFPLQLASLEGMREINRIIGQACNSNPRLRFASAGEFQEALNMKRRRLPVVCNKKIKYFLALATLVFIILGISCYVSGLFNRNNSNTDTNSDAHTLNPGLSTPQESDTSKITNVKKITYPQAGSFTADDKVADDF